MIKCSYKQSNVWYKTTFRDFSRYRERNVWKVLYECQTWGIVIGPASKEPYIIIK